MKITGIHGIYKITNSITNKFYIGSATNLASRKSSHKRNLMKGSHVNIILQRAYDKYGPENLVFEVLENVENKNKLIEREQYYIDTLNPEYNICKTAGSILGVKFSVESREKISKLHAGVKNHNYGKIFTEEQKLNLSLKAKERMRDPARRELHREVHRKNMKPVVQYSLQNDFIEEFDCINDASRALKINKAQIQYCCKGKYKTAGGFLWKYKDLKK